MLYYMLIQDGPRAGDSLYLVSDGNSMNWFELDGTPLATSIEEIALAYTCIDPEPPHPDWYVG